MNELIAKVKSMFADDVVKLVVGFEKGNRGARPFFCKSAEEADKLILDEHCPNNVAVYLTKKELLGDGKVAFVVNTAALRSALELSVENQWKEGRFVFLTLNPGGEAVQLENAEAIAAYLQEHPLAVNDEDRQLLDSIRSMTPAERWKYWTYEMSKCIKCYACRAACPLCYCTKCIVEENRPQWIQPWSAPLSNIEWQINRAMHQAGRCTGCGACKEACPVGIPIHLLTLSMMEDAMDVFGQKPGEVNANGNMLSTFRVEDKEDFIR